MPDTVREMMSAYVAGCLDIRNLEQFIDFLEQGDYIPLEEFGELQNIASLIPILLERETPPASLQNDIFSKIPETKVEGGVKRVKRKVNLSEIIKEELEEISTENEEDAEIEIPETVSFTSSGRETAIKEVAEKVEEEIFATKKTSLREQKVKETEKERKIDSEEENPYPHVKIKAKDEKDVKDENFVIPPEEEIDETGQEFDGVEYEHTKISGVSKKTLLIWKIIAVVASVIALIFIVSYFSSKSSYEEEIAELQKIVKADKIEIEDKSDFINKNLPLIELFEFNDLVVVNLMSTSSEGTVDARIIVSPSARRGILQFFKIPNIKENEALQVWVVNKGQSYSVGVIHPQNGKKFYTLSKIPFIPFEEIEMFRITKEPKSGSEFPSGNTVYFGAFLLK